LFKVVLAEILHSARLHPPEVVAAEHIKTPARQQGAMEAPVVAEE
jgi:hypothetical protein